MAIAAARARSPLELPPRTASHEQDNSRGDRVLSVLSDEVTRRPISLGVLLLAVGVTCFLSFSLSAVMFRNAAVRSGHASQATERRLGHELMQLRASASALQAQLDLRARDIAAQADEIERISAQLETLRELGSAGRGVRARRYERR